VFTLLAATHLFTKNKMIHVWGKTQQVKNLNIIRNPLEYLVAFPVHKSQFDYYVGPMDAMYRASNVPAPWPDVRNVGGIHALPYFQNTSRIWLK
jgi:hypothetical protein